MIRIFFNIVLRSFFPNSRVLNTITFNMAALFFNVVNKCFFNKTLMCTAKKQLLCHVYRNNIIPDRGIRFVYARFEKTMKKRRKLAGPEAPRRRSEWAEWNYKAELFAFPKRLNEEITPDTLRIAFIHKSYIDAEERKRLELDMPVQQAPLNLIANTELVAVGENVMSKHVQSFIRYCFPHLPEEGILAVHDYLLSDEVLSHVSSNIGTTDLILSGDFPVEKPTLAVTLKAVVGAIVVDNNEKQGELFVNDFICTQLIGKDILEIWDIQNPLQLVDTILKEHGRAPWESRLVFESGRNTIEAIYQVALYSDKVFLGQAPGETLTIAEEMAGYDVLRRLFQIGNGDKPLPFGKAAKELQLNFESKNAALSEWHSKKFEDKNCEL